MAYCRFGDDSDVYVYYGDVWYCCGCKLHNHPEFTSTTREGMVEHLQTHQTAGHKVPSYAFERLATEIAAGCQIWDIL